MIHFACPTCAKTFQVKDEFAGRRTKCPKCGQAIQVPAPASGAPGVAGAPSSEFPPSSHPPGRRQSRAALFIGLGAGVLVLVIGIVLVTLMASDVFSKSGSDQQVYSQAQNAKKSDTKGSDQPEKAATPSKPPDEKPKDESQETEESKKKERARQEAEHKKKALQEAIQTATALQAPPSGKGKASNADGFLLSMRELAGNEFKFRQSREVVYRSTFNQKEQEQVVSWYVARNAILDPGKYDFDAKVYTLPLHFYFWHYKQSTGLGGKVLPETTDYVSVQAKIDMDQDTAAKMREAFDKRLLSLTIWYRLRNVARASWEANPHWTDGRLAHAISFGIEVLKIELASDAR